MATASPSTASGTARAERRALPLVRSARRCGLFGPLCHHPGAVSQSRCQRVLQRPEVRARRVGQASQPLKAAGAGPRWLRCPLAGDFQGRDCRSLASQLNALDADDGSARRHLLGSSAGVQPGIVARVGTGCREPVGCAVGHAFPANLRSPLPRRDRLPEPGSHRQPARDPRRWARVPQPRRRHRHHEVSRLRPAPGQWPGTRPRRPSSSGRAPGAR